MADVQIQDGMVIRVPVTVLDAHDRSNIRCLAGTRTVLMEGPFLSGSAEVLAEPPAAPEDTLTKLLATVTLLSEKVTALEGRSARRSPAGAVESAPPSI